MKKNFVVKLVTLGGQKLPNMRVRVSSKFTSKKILKKIKSLKYIMSVVKGKGPMFPVAIIIVTSVGASLRD
jgi:hypothetical protein